MNKTTTALTLGIEKATYMIIDERPQTESADYWNGYELAAEEIKKYLISLLQKEREDMENAFSISRHMAEISYTSCGDPMMCGCQGSCQHPIAYIKKNTARNDATQYFNNNFTQYKTTDNG